MPTDLLIWNERFDRCRQDGVSIEMGDAQWLAPFVPLFRAQRVRRVLEVGCGTGADTVQLVQAGFEVTATDFSPSALTIVRDHLAEVPLLLHDTRDRFPFGDEAFDLIVGGLSLHYFDRETMSRIVQDLRRLLRPRGLLLYRMNSTNDPECGNGQGDLLEPDTYLQNGIRRRYFTLESCRETFAGWEELLLEEKVTGRFGKEKVVCEGLVRKVE